MKVWITKYALERGVIEADARLLSLYENFARCDNGTQKYYFSGSEWSFKKEDAVAKANEMRQEEIERLKNQIKKLEEIRFE